MYALVATFALALSLHANSDGVTLADAYTFGVSRETVRPLWQLAERHRGTMAAEVYTWNNPRDGEAWSRECEWRSRCWYFLDDALFCDHLTAEQKLRSLAELRRLIGDEAYYAGRMPDPTPKYRPWSK